MPLGLFNFSVWWVGGGGRLLSVGIAYEGLKKTFKFRLFVVVCLQIDGPISQGTFYDGIASW